MRSKISQTSAIVLRRYHFRETSLIISFYTKHFGKVTGIVKGIRKDPKRFGSYLDIYTINDIVFYHHPKKNLDLISQAVLVKNFLQTIAK